METNKTEVLVIDDDMRTAEAYAELITVSCGIQSCTSSNKQESLDCLRNNPIKIVLLDEKLDGWGISGSMLFPLLKQIKPDLKIIMVTGQASAEDILNADSLKYAAKLHKNNISKLPELIYRIYAEYERDLAQNIINKNPFYKEWKFKLFHIGYIKYFLIDYKIINENYTESSGWKTVDRINQGEQRSKEVVIEFSNSEKISISQEFKSNINTTNTFLSKLNYALDSSISSHEECVNAKKETTKQTTELSIQDGEMFENKKVISKVYEENQVYKQLLIHIRKVCDFCDEYSIIPLIIHQPVNKKIFRLKVYTDDNCEHIIDTGDYTR